MKSIKKNAIINIIRVAANMIFPILIFPYISRVLGPAGLGKVNFATATMNYFTLIASLGIPTYGVLICAKKRKGGEEIKKTICELLYINFVLIFLSYALLLIIIQVIPKYQEYKSLLLIDSLSIIFTAIGIEWFYMAMEEFDYITIRSIVFKIISIVLIFTFVKDSGDYIQYAIILIFSSVGANILNFVHARKYIKFYALKELNIKQHLKPIIVFFTASVAATINSNTDTVMLGFFKGEVSVGLYDFSVKIKSLLVSVITAGLSVTTPRFALYVAEEKFDVYRALLRKVVLFTMVIAISCSLFFVVFSKDIILVLGGSKYLQARSAMVVLTLCIIVLGMTWSLGVGVLQPLGREKKYAKVMIIACFINISLNACLIPVLDVTGAAIATLITEISNMCLFYYYAKDFLKDSLKRMGFLKIFLCAALAGIISGFICKLLEANSLIVLIMGFLIYFMIYGASVLLVHKEIRQASKNIFSIVLTKINIK